MKRVKITTEDFITKAKEVHGDKYDYSNVEYVNTNVKVCIICPEHGEFCQSPHGHLRGRGCPKCGANKRHKSRTSTTEIFIEKARKIHGDKYDYSKINYINNHTKVCIVCPEHGEFWQTPGSHTNTGNGCPLCGNKNGSEKRLKSINIFIKQAKEIHGDKYDYSKVEYSGNHEKVIIICPEHGEFLQSPDKHLQGHRCPKCAGGIKLTTEDFLKKAKEVHGDKYDYSKVEYINSHTNVCIICPKHGEFWQTPRSHLAGSGCSKCSGNAKSNTEEFIKKAQLIHGNKYDYSETVYISADKKVKIICPLHGEFYVAVNHHLSGRGCPKCAGNIKLTTEDFLKKAKEVHGDKYDYSKVDYKTSIIPVCIICPKHGEFLQKPNTHLCGCGCPKCGASKSTSKMELKIKSFLEDNNIKYIPQHSFDWLKYENPLKLDFYLPEYNIAIECQGGQHFRPIDFFGGEQGYELIVKRDIAKLNLCKEHNINILYFTNENVSVPKKWEHYKVIKSLDKLLKKIYK